jgi:hypothetical protein
MIIGVPANIRLEHDLKLLEQQCKDNTQDIIKIVEDMPTKITEELLKRFEVNGAHQLMEHRVQEMIEKSNESMRDVLLKEIRAIQVNCNQEARTPQSSAAEEWPGGELIDGTMQWVWRGRIHMVPEGWCLPKGNVSMLFNLWVNGNPAMQLRPYRFLKGYDLQATANSPALSSEQRARITADFSVDAGKKVLDTATLTWRTYLTQARDVMIVIEHESGMKFHHLAALSAQEREKKYIEAFHQMCRYIRPHTPQSHACTCVQSRFRALRMHMCTCTSTCAHAYTYARTHLRTSAHTHRRMYPDLSDEQLDAKRMYDKSYMTIYSELSKKKMLRKTLGKRKDRNQASEQADTP